MGTTADDKYGENQPAEIARLASMAEQYGPQILTEEEFALVRPEREQRLNPEDHNANLAEHLSEGELRVIAQQVVDWVAIDEASRKKWYEREKRGMAIVGLIDDEEFVAPFEGATTATHPIIAEAVTNFQARAIAELWPSGGPVKSVVMGDDQDGEVRKQADRVSDFMNWQYEEVIDGFVEQDKLLMRLPMSGSCFKKCYFDDNSREARSEFVEPADFLVPYTASSLRKAPRFTHRIRNVSGRSIKRSQASGYYRELGFELRGDGNVSTGLTEVHEAIDAAEGREPVDDFDADAGHTLYECHCYLDLPGFEDPRGIPLPYIVTMEVDQQVVLSIRRGWKRNDPDRERRLQFIHYWFLPGHGFYGYGFIHLIGGLGQAATGALRSFLDAVGLSNMRGGFRSSDAKLSNQAPLGMGEWREVDMTAEELSKCFFPMDYREPSIAMFQVLGYLDELGRRYSSTTENLVGDANNNGPVGTTLALIEQGLKVFSAIHKRLHTAQATEFRVMSEIYAEHLPDGEYPYLVEGKTKVVMRADFDSRVDVRPVSDPNVVSNIQRITKHQAVIELASQATDLYDLRVAHRRMLEAMQVSDIEDLLPEPEEAEPRDPVAEGVALLSNQPVKAFVDQDHQAHMSAHIAWWASAVPEDMRKDLEPAYKAHMAEHLGMSYRLQVLSALGISPDDADADPRIQDAIARGAAEFTQLSAPKNIGLAGTDSTDKGRGSAALAADIERKNAAAAAEIERKDASAMAQIERDDAKVQAEIERAASRDIQEAAREAVQTQAALKDIESAED